MYCWKLPVNKWPKVVTKYSEVAKRGSQKALRKVLSRGT